MDFSLGIEFFIMKSISFFISYQTMKVNSLINYNFAGSNYRLFKKIQ